MYREPLNNLQLIEYLKRTKEDTTIEEHRMALDASIRVFEKMSNPEIINIKMNKRIANDLISFVNQTITDAQETLNGVDPKDRLVVDVWKNGINFWNDVKDAIEDAQKVLNTKKI